MASDSIALFLSTFFTGAPSYVVFFVGSRTLDAPAMATFVTLWAVANTALLALTLPADTYAPRFRLECITAEVNDSDRLFAISVYSISAGALVALVPLVLLVAGLLGIDAAGALSIALFGLSSAFFASRRAYLTSNGEFTRYLLQTVVLGVVGVGGLFAVLAADPGHQAWLYGALSAANLAAAVAVSPRGRPRPAHLTRRVRVLWPFIHSIGALPTLRRLVVVTLIAVALSNGSVTVARLIGAEAADIVAYAAAVNLVLIPCTLLNSFTGPIHNRFVQSILHTEFAHIRRDYLRSASYYLVFVAVLAVGSYFGLSFAIGTYIGNEYSLTPLACSGIAIAEGLATVTALPRALLVAMGETRVVTPIWLAGLAAFAMALAAPIDPLQRLVLAPGVAALTILVTSTAHLNGTLLRRQRATMQTSSV